MTLRATELDSLYGERPLKNSPPILEHGTQRASVSVLNHCISIALFFVGLGIGTASGIGIAWGAAEYSKHNAPNDPSAGSIGIIIIFTFPIGLLFGWFIGLVLMGIHAVKCQAAIDFKSSNDQGKPDAG